MQTIAFLQENQTALKQQQQLLINLAMKQAFHVLQLPMLELSEWLHNEIESNPVLEIDFSKEPLKEALEEPVQKLAVLRNKSQENAEKRRQEHQDSKLAAQVSLYEHLIRQVPLLFKEHEDLHLATLVIGHLNEKGFLDTPLNEIAPLVSLKKMEEILETVQSFDPPGIGARNLQECLLLQLKLKGKENSAAATIIREHFDALLHNRLSLIARQIGIPLKTLAQIVEKEIALLDLNPGYKYSPPLSTAIIPDLLLSSIEGKWKVEVNQSLLPKFHMAPIYIQALQDPNTSGEENSYLRRQFTGGRWLKTIVQRRNHTLRSIGEFLLKKHIGFFEGEKGALASVSMKEAAEALGVHESTIARAISNKYLACPQGCFALHSFFKQGVETKNGGTISNHTLREMVANMIENEDKQSPLSDEQLAKHFHQQGIRCARRTIAKYRASLDIPPACQRKKWV